MAIDLRFAVRRIGVDPLDRPATFGGHLGYETLVAGVVLGLDIDKEESGDVTAGENSHEGLISHRHSPGPIGQYRAMVDVVEFADTVTPTRRHWLR